MDIGIEPLDEAGLADLLAAAVAGTEPAEVLPAPAGAPWDDRLRTAFGAFHRGRALAADPVERVWVVRERGRAVGALRLEPVDDRVELGLWLSRDARGRGVGAAAVRLLRSAAPGLPLVARTTVGNRAALGLLRTLGADTAPGTDGGVTGRWPSVDHG